MAHIAQERYSTLVDEKLRYTLVTKDNLIFNPRYEGNPKAGKVKVPVRDTEVEVKKYDKQTGAAISAGSTTYFDINIDIDEAVNEMIDGFDAESVPDGITAERLDSAGYSLGLSMDTRSIRALEETTGITVAASKTACTESTAYKQVLAAKRVQSRMGVPNDGKRWLLASPEFMEVLLTDDRFVKQGDLSQELVQSGVVAESPATTYLRPTTPCLRTPSWWAARKPPRNSFAVTRTGAPCAGVVCSGRYQEPDQRVYRFFCGTGQKGLRHRYLQAADGLCQESGGVRHGIC